ncbi:hypothetical protein D0Z07_4135 [Hyphodiscus hymeniophilus]|uniref:Gamma-glutamylcyclotransferase AIG2-like domain-containing protein n=1 Tax=Hyphodiscus hymeniophilus TaxID=353542 RepID=A0A9P6VJM1_9HELO|nr:hypothetical protein D0Z07_4135 [Hyphodiscus hymeniophilus]
MNKPSGGYEDWYPSDRTSQSRQAYDSSPNIDDDVGFRPQYFFLYGSLMDTKQLRKILRQEETPILQPASIEGWEVMMWGRYPALIFKPNSTTHGVACEIRKRREVEYLQQFDDGREVPGKTFVWNAGMEELKEASFDLKDWQMESLEKRT